MLSSLSLDYRYIVVPPFLPSYLINWLIKHLSIVTHLVKCCQFCIPCPEESKLGAFLLLTDQPGRILSACFSLYLCKGAAKDLLFLLSLNMKAKHMGKVVENHRQSLWLWAI